MLRQSCFCSTRSWRNCWSERRRMRVARPAFRLADFLIYGIYIRSKKAQGAGGLGEQPTMTNATSRRTFMQMTAAGLTVSLLEIPTMNANPLNLPVGLQLYTVGKEMDSDPAGTLKAVAAAGYKQVELSPLANM